MIHKLWKIQFWKKLFGIGFPYKPCNFGPFCLPVKMASKTVTRPIQLELTNRGNLFTWNIWKTKRDIAVFSFKSDGTLTLLVLMYWLCRDSFILWDNFTFHANFCNSILLFPSPMYATRYLCCQGNIRQMCIFFTHCWR